MPTTDTPTNAPTTPKTELRRLRDSTTLKIIVLGGLLLALWIPLGLVQNLVREREQRRSSVIQEIGTAWGQAQTLVGPIVSYRYVCDPSLIPQESELTCKGHSASHQQTLLRRTQWSVELDPEVRKRSIYEAVVWQGKLNAKGDLQRPSLITQRFGLPYRLTSATVVVGLSDQIGLSDEAIVLWNGQQLPLYPHNSSSILPQHALTANLPLDSVVDPENLSTLPTKIELSLALRGTERLWFVPSSSTTKINLTSDWTSPSFTGGRLPEAHDISTSGFTASWNVRGDSSLIPQKWWDNDYDTRSSLHLAFGVDLVKPVNGYGLTTRATKYGLLFLLLTFTTFFLLEVTSSVRLHPIQYLLVGGALCLFYLLLLSLTEHIGFTPSYLIASTATISTIGIYSSAISRSRRWGGTMVVGLAVLYSYLYVLLKLEDFALLLGSIALFLFLAAIMWITRNLDWYNLEFRPREEVTP